MTVKINERMRVLVTGGSGFIGTNLIELLIQEGCEVVNIDISRPRNERHIKYWIDVDIMDREKLLRSFEDFIPDYVVHLAARTDLHSGSVISEYKVNFVGVDNVLFCASNQSSVVRTIVASSMLVCKVGYTPKNFLDYCPTTIYGESKVLTEKITRNYDIDWILVRPTSIWGPWFGPPYRDFFELVVSGWFFNISENRAATKTYGYVGNACLQIYALLLSNNTSVRGNTYYLGDELPMNVSVWANLVAKCSLQKPPLTLPFFVYYLAALVGDFLSNFGVKFPLTSFRLRNMTCDNVIDIGRTNQVVKNEIGKRFSLSLTSNIQTTLNWLNQVTK